VAAGESDRIAEQPDSIDALMRRQRQRVPDGPTFMKQLPVARPWSARWCQSRFTGLLQKGAPTKSWEACLQSIFVVRSKRRALRSEFDFAAAGPSN